MSGLRKTYAGIDFNSGTPDADGATWWIDEFEGWGSPALRRQSVEMTARHGTRQSDSRYDERTIVIGGFVKAGNEEGYWKAHNKLLAATSGLYGDLPFVVYETVPKQVMARPSMETRIEAPNGNSTLRFQVTLVAQNPFKTALTEKTFTLGSGASLTVTNDGTWPANPSLTTTTGGYFGIQRGGGGGPLLGSDPDKGLAAGAQVDFEERTFINHLGENVYGKLGSGARWFSLLPGDNEISNQGASAFTFKFRDTYL